MPNTECQGTHGPESLMLIVISLMIPQTRAGILACLFVICTSQSSMSPHVSQDYHNGYQGCANFDYCLLNELD